MSNVSQMSKDIYAAVERLNNNIMNAIRSTESGVQEQTPVPAFHKAENIETRKLKRIWQSSKEFEVSVGWTK